MQMLAERNEEGQARGLAWVPGRVRHFESTGRMDGLPFLPHMGWNDVTPQPAAPLFAGLEQDARFYFLHSFHFECQDAADVAAEANYGGRFTARSGAVASTACKATPRRATTGALRCCATSLSWKPDHAAPRITPLPARP